jgi:hypothetical protein
MQPFGVVLFLPDAQRAPREIPPSAQSTRHRVENQTVTAGICELSAAASQLHRLDRHRLADGEPVNTIAEGCHHAGELVAGPPWAGLRVRGCSPGVVRGSDEGRSRRCRRRAPRLPPHQVPEAAPADL